MPSGIGAYAVALRFQCARNGSQNVVVVVDKGDGRYCISCLGSLGSGHTVVCRLLGFQHNYGMWPTLLSTRRLNDL